MPANLTPEYLQAEQRFKQAEALPEKVAALEKMLATIPKHKGTEKMQADLKRRLAKLRQEVQKKHAVARHKPFYQVERQGAGQVLLVGPPNSGKSRLLAALTAARPEVAEYPFTTRAPQPGMMPYENIQIQLVDTPALAPGLVEGWQLGLIRNADSTLLVFDASDEDLLGETEWLLNLLAEARIDLSDSGKRALLVGNKLDRPTAQENFHAWKELYGERFSVLGISIQTGLHLEELKSCVFRSLGIIRVYTKAPGKKPEFTAPFVLKKGSTVEHAAAVVHHDFIQRLKFARVWGRGKFEGQMVGRDHVLEDGDLLELHA